MLSFLWLRAQKLLNISRTPEKKILKNNFEITPFLGFGHRSENALKSSFFKINSKISIFKPSHTFIKVAGHQNEQLLYFTVFCETNGIEVMAILRSRACRRTTKSALFRPVTFKILIFEKNAKP